MIPRPLVATLLGLLLSLASPAYAAHNDLPRLVPARTLAYLELHDPPHLARELHALCKGSYLQNPAAFLGRHALQPKKNNSEAFILSWLGSPEFIDELGDWQGGCLALTGFTKNDDPEVVGVLRTGRSRMLPVALRMVLLESGDFHCIARVESVPIFQVGEAQKRKGPEVARRAVQPAAELARLFRGPRARMDYRLALLDDMPVAELDEKPEFGCFLALLPGVIAGGTTLEILSETIRRLKGKSTSPSLAGVPAFRAAAQQHDQPGMFAWSDPPRLTRRVNDALHRQLLLRQDEIRQRPLAKGEKRDPAKLRQELIEAETQHRRETAEWTFFQTVANPDGMRYAAAGWYLHEGAFACYADVRMKDKQTSLLLDLLASEKVSPALLRAVPGDAFGLFVLPIPDGTGTLTRLLKLADAYAALQDEKATLPSQQLRELEKSLKLRLGRDLLAKIRSAAVAVHLVGQPDKQPNLHAVLLIEAVHEDAARGLEGLLPRLYGIDGKRAEARRHRINAQVVHSLTDAEFEADLTGPPMHYGRSGTIVALGWHRGRVADTLRECESNKDLLNLPRGRATVDAEGPVSALGLFSCRQLLSHLTRLGSQNSQQEAAHLRSLRYLRELSAPMATMPPTVFAIKRSPDGFRVAFRQGELPATSATVIDIALTWLLDEEAGGAVFNQRWQRQ
jgi:hypothetical protein